ncbi:unnamed protein product [Calicophoron daubneyi]|uniref:Major facilitator superfamily (MFS) profile domain-containing protein n=1 Tax=Calicophoron daubneyi TaxID=300641 RepID=A0AAV2TS85_CALDB
MGVFNLPHTHIKAFLLKTVLNNTDGGVVDGALLYAQVGTTLVIGGAFGAFSSGWMADTFGRRNTLLVNHMFAISGGILCALCVNRSQFILLYLGRFLSGINCGITIGVATMYLTEIAPRRLRGAVGASHQLALTLGAFVSYLVTLDRVQGTADAWPNAALVGTIPAITSLIILPLLPESPRFLSVKNNRKSEAIRAVSRLSTISNVPDLMRELTEEAEVAKKQPEFRFRQLFVEPRLRMPLMISCLIPVFQQLSGINAVVTYSASILSTAGVPPEISQYCVAGFGLINFLMTVMSIPLLERAGRRTMLLWPTVLMALSLLILTISVTLGQKYQGLPNARPFSYASVVLIILYFCGFGLGPGPVPALVVAEIFTQGPRAAACSLSHGLLWVSQLLVLFGYPSLNDKIGGYSLLPFFVVAVTCWVFFLLYMPETKNRSYDEIACELAAGGTVFRRNGKFSRYGLTDSDSSHGKTPLEIVIRK